MKIRPYYKHILIQLVVITLIFGIGWGTAQADSFFVYSQADMIHSISDSTDGFADSASTVLSSVKIRQVELMQSKVTVLRNHLTFGVREYLLWASIFLCLFHSKRQGRDVFAESDIVGLLCGSKIVKYVHQTDGEKGRGCSFR